MQLKELPGTFAIFKLKPGAPLPTAVLQSAVYSITKTEDELSVLCEQSLVPQDTPCESDWKAFRVVGTLDFSLTGILAAIATPLAQNKISIFAISTFDTDYVLVKSHTWEQTVQTLRKAGFIF